MKKVIAIIALIIIAAMPFIACASSVTVSAGSCKVGDAVSVQIVFKNNNIGAVEASFTYDSSKLDFVSGNNASSQSAGTGKIVLYAGSSGLNSLSTTLGFKAKASGNASINVSTSCVLSFDEAVLDNCSSSCTITISDTGSAVTPTPKKTAEIVTVSPSKQTAKATSSKNGKKATSSASAEPSVSPSPSQEPVIEGVTVYVDGTRMTMAEEIPCDLPNGFHINYTVYNEKTIETAYNAETDTTLAYLYADGETEGSFYKWEKNGSFTKLVSVNGSMIVLPIPDDNSLPDYVSGLQKTKLSLECGVADGFSISENETLLYCINGGKYGWYIYNSVDETLQSYHEPITITVSAEPTETDAPVEQAEPEADENKNNALFYGLISLTQKTVDTAVIVVFAAAAIVFIIIIIVVAHRLSRKPPKGKH